MCKRTRDNSSKSYVRGARYQIPLGPDLRSQHRRAGTGLLAQPIRLRRHSGGAGGRHPQRRLPYRCARHRYRRRGTHGRASQLRAAHVDTGKLRFVDADGNTIATITPEYLAGGTTDRHIELPRGELASILYDLTRDGLARYRFNDSIEALHDDGAGVDVRFKSGTEQRFDIVIGADGMHSNTRALVFGPEAPFIRYLGFCFNLFSMPNNAGLSHEAVVYAEPGRVTGVYAVGDSRTLLVFLNFAADEPPFQSNTDVDKQRQRKRKLSDMAGRYFVVPLKPCSALMTSFSTRSARSTCRAGRPAESRWSATPLTRRHSCRERAPAWRLLARMCLPANSRCIRIPPTPLHRTNG
jgi:2-polyprenyl-6-methoxyphenol hydroxylase-like FAD-dependent oxidoreductase